jgi:tetratricopeptide (TPR) repeat protein
LQEESLMAAADPYSPCPCGSGEKYKWCCQKVEAHADKVQRLIENHQLDSALKAIDEGLRAEPLNPLLILRKAMILGHRKEFDAAQSLVRKLLVRHPKHAVAHDLQIRLALQTQNPVVAAGLLQEALTAVPDEQSAVLSESAEIVGASLLQAGRAPAAMAHFVLAEALDTHQDEARSALRSIESETSLSAYLRNPFRLSPVPEGLPEARAERFAQALAWADQGLWSAAAAAFDTLSAECTPESDRNLGLCRLWLGDHAGAIDALRRYTGWIGANPDTVDLEALCQTIAPISEDDRVDLLQWIWPIRDRNALKDWLASESLVHAKESEPIDPSDPKSPEVDVYLILSKPPVGKTAVRDAADIPSIEGRLLVGREIVVVEAYDDGRLDRLADWFRDKAGTAIPPAHPRTKRVGRSSRVANALRAEWLLPEGIDAEFLVPIAARDRARILETVWPDLPLPPLGGRTPRQAARSGNATLPLRAAVCALECSFASPGQPLDFDRLRASLGLEPEPQIDPATVAIDRVPLPRLHLVPIAKLTDAQLLDLFGRAHRYQLPVPLERAARALNDRPAVLEREKPALRFAVFCDLANLAFNQGDIQGAFGWLEHGRRDEPVAHRNTNAVEWDLFELRLRTRSQPIEAWAPHLAALLERHRNNPEANSEVLTTLVQLGLVQLVPSPDKPGEMYLDTRTLQAVLARYGPRITTATGELGVTAAKPAIWTPGSEAGRPQGGGIWTPGSQRTPSPPGEPSKIIITGR